MRLWHWRGGHVAALDTCPARCERTPTGRSLVGGQLCCRPKHGHVGPREFTLDTRAVRDRLGSTGIAPLPPGSALHSGNAHAHCRSGLPSLTPPPRHHPLLSSHATGRGGLTVWVSREDPTLKSLPAHDERAEEGESLARTMKADLPLTSPSSTDPPQGRGQGGLRSAPRQQGVPQVSKRVLLTMEFLKTA